MLKRQKHTGATLAGVESPDSLADHTSRAAIIGFMLAHYEKVDPYRTSAMLLFHDMPECRTGDQHKVAARYIDSGQAEANALQEQIEVLPADLQKQIAQLYEQAEQRTSPEGIVAKDADWLEMAVTAREYVSRGYTGLEEWINNIRKALETETAKKWLELIATADPNEWWRGLKKMTYTKLSKKS